MSRLAYPLVVCVAVAGLAVLWQQSSAADAAPNASGAKPTFVLNLTSGTGDLHRSTMALHLAQHAADDGRTVVIFLNVRGAELARREGAAERFKDNPPPRDILAKLMARGTQVHVCPMCLEAIGMKPDMLIPGCIVTDREKLFAHFTANANVVSY